MSTISENLRILRGAKESLTQNASVGKGLGLVVGGSAIAVGLQTGSWVAPIIGGGIACNQVRLAKQDMKDAQILENIEQLDALLSQYPTANKLLVRSHLLAGITDRKIPKDNYGVVVPVDELRTTVEKGFKKMLRRNAEYLNLDQKSGKKVI